MSNKYILLQKSLIDFGLTLNESRVYVSLQKMGIVGVKEILFKTAIKRSSIYVALASLQKRGLVSTVLNQTVIKYISTSPEKLQSIIKERLDSYIYLNQKAKHVLPKIGILQRKAKLKPKVSLLLGIEGLIKSFNLSLKAKEKTIRVASSVENIYKILPKYLAYYVKKRRIKGLKMKGIHPNGHISKILSREDKIFDDIALIPAEKFKLPSDLAIYDNTVALMSTQKKISILIESEPISDIMKIMFDLAWRRASGFKS